MRTENEFETYFIFIAMEASLILPRLNENLN